MPKHCIYSLIALTLIAKTLLAQEVPAKPTAGTLTLDKKTYELKHALAYETTIDNEETIVVLLSGQTVSNESLAEAKTAEKEGSDGGFKRPFLKLAYKKSGELKHWSAAAGGTSLGRRSGKAAGELTTSASRVSGKATQPMETEGMFPTGFEVRFDVPLLKANDSLPASPPSKSGPAANVKPTVSGVFKGNGRETKLSYVSARWGEPFSGKPGIVLVFTEKDHTKDKKPDSGAMFGRFGSALIISLHQDGSIYGCQVVHSAHRKSGVSSIGQIEANDFTYADGKVEGELTTHGQVDTFGDTWEVNLKFLAPLGEMPNESKPAEAKKPSKDERKELTARSGAEDEGEESTQSNGPELKAKELALTKDASEVEYKSLVHQIAFKSSSEVKSVCAELAANLKTQGWKKDGTDMVQPRSSILKRKQGSASLTIFVKPSEGGSEIKMMTEGLSWE